jgi:hypothetical protein
VAMPFWVIGCVNCKTDFVYAKIDDYKLDEFLNPRKPEVPAQGYERECPSCGHKGAYARTDLVYSHRTYPA